MIAIQRGEDSRKIDDLNPSAANVEIGDGWEPKKADVEIRLAAKKKEAIDWLRAVATAIEQG